MVTCTYPVIGRFTHVALVQADECGAPIPGPGMGWVDTCAAAASMTDVFDEAENFTRRCADQTVLVDVPGVDTLTGIEWTLDLHGADPALMSTFGGGQPVNQGATNLIGWDDCKNGRGSIAVYLWRQIVGDSACDPDTGEPQWLLTILPWSDNVRTTVEGDFGSAESYLRLTGTSRTGHDFRSGGLMVQSGVDGEPVCFVQPMTPDCVRRNVITSIPPPDVCGLIEINACQAIIVTE